MVEQQKHGAQKVEVTVKSKKHAADSSELDSAEEDINHETQLD